MLVGQSVGVESVPLIALPVMVVVSLGPFLGIANQLISPIASQLDATNRVDELRAAYLTTVRFTLTMGLFIYACIILVSPYLLPLWLGGDTLEPHHVHAIHLNLLLIFGGYCVAIPALLARSVLVSVGMHKAAARGELISCLGGLLIGWMLMDTLDFGVTGMACGIAAAYLIRAGAFLVRQLALYFNMSIYKLFVEVWRLPLLTTVPLVVAFIPQTISNLDFQTVVLFGLAALGLWGWLVWRKIMPLSHRFTVYRILRKTLHRKESR